MLGKELYDPVEIVKYLKTFDCLKLAEISEQMRTLTVWILSQQLSYCMHENTLIMLNFQERLQLLYPFGPGVDDRSKDPFMPVPIREAAKKGMDVPCLLGYNNREGIYALYRKRIGILQISEEFMNNRIYFSALRKYDFQFFNKNYEMLFHPHLTQKLKLINVAPAELLKIYRWEDANEDNYTEKIVDVMTDLYVVEGFHELIKHQVLSKKKPVYLYKFTYDQGISFTKLMINSTMSGKIKNIYTRSCNCTANDTIFL